MSSNNTIPLKEKKYYLHFYYTRELKADMAKNKNS